MGYLESRENLTKLLRSNYMRGNKFILSHHDRERGNSMLNSTPGFSKGATPFAFNNPADDTGPKCGFCGKVERGTGHGFKDIYGEIAFVGTLFVNICAQLGVGFDHFHELYDLAVDKIAADK